MPLFFWSLFVGFAMSFIITWLLIPLLIRCARMFKILDIPDGQVKQHTQPTPYLGGVAFFIGFCVTVSFFVALSPSLLIFMGIILILLLVGLIDDFYVLSPLQKMIGQIVAVFGILWLALIQQPHFFQIGYVAYAIIIGWALTVINAFNLIDIMDGLAATTSIIATGAFLSLALVSDGQYSVLIIILTAFLGALIAFLTYNKPPAYIYMGDAGALSIGGFFASIPFLFTWNSLQPYAFVAPIIILAIPLLEVATLIVVRMAKGIPPYKPSPDHFALILKKRGWSVEKILSYTVFMGSLAGIGGFIFAFGWISGGQCVCAGFLFLSVWSLKFLLDKAFF